MCVLPCCKNTACWLCRACFVFVIYVLLLVDRKFVLVDHVLLLFFDMIVFPYDFLLLLFVESVPLLQL